MAAVKHNLVGSIRRWKIFLTAAGFNFRESEDRTNSQPGSGRDQQRCWQGFPGNNGRSTGKTIKLLYKRRTHNAKFRLG